MSAGRKCEFDKTKALHSAMLTFWERGYLGASLSELTSNMGINKPSMYAAFGNKEALFLSAVDYYLERYGREQMQCLHDKQRPPKERLLNFLAAVINMQFDGDLPKGCLVSQCSSESNTGNLPSSAVDKITQVRNSTSEILLTFFDDAKHSGTLPKGFDSVASANVIGLLIHGSAVMSKIGTKAKDIENAFIIVVESLALDG